MTISQFFRLFQFVCGLFYSFFEIIFNIRLCANIYLGNLLLIVVIFSVAIAIIKRPTNGK